MGEYWIWLAQLTGISAKRKMALLQTLLNPKAIYEAGEQAIDALEDPTAKEINALGDRTLEKAQKLAETCRAKGISILPITHKAYPQNLLQISDPPILLYFKGQLPRWDTFPVVGVVGTRKASAYGLQCAYDMCTQIGSCGGLVISGGALGVDAAAMEGALRQGYPSVGVLGCGIDVLYPKENKPLFDMTIRNGCVLSEFAPGTPAYPSNLARRNRLISGISDGLLVVEAPAKSGALITANYAKDQKKDVFVIPGNLDNPACAGSNDLLRKGAKAVLCGYDIVGIYKDRFPERVRNKILAAAPPDALPDKKPIDKGVSNAYSGKEPLKELTGAEKLVYDVLTDQPIHVDAIVAKTGLRISQVLAAITMLTVGKRINNLPGKYFTKR
jgi:DNA processing protein